jgi:hypothetical protein
MSERDDLDEKSPRPKTQSKYNFNSAKYQRQRALVRLRKNPATTIELRREEDIMMPAARVFELRALGHKIDTIWIEQPTECGRIHRVAQYVLIEEATV